jgi:type II secretory pathway predicted ATPase ExeA
MQAHDSTLSSKAFGELADDGLVVAYQSHQDAMRFLASSLSQTNGVAILRGPNGSGKTTISKEQLAWSKRDAAVAYVDGKHLVPRRLVTDMLSQFGVGTTAAGDDQQLLQQLSNFLSQQTRNGEAPILFVDDADRATSSALRLLNWLAALDANSRFSLRIVLTGKDKLADLLRDDGMRNLARRHPATYTLNPLSEQETMIYLRTRLIAAGGERSEKVFPVDICAQLHVRSGGWPGQLNTRAIEVMERMAELKSARPTPKILVTRDGDTVAEYGLTDREYVIGRNELADIIVEDSYVSKIHAMLKVYSNAIVLLDLNSTNGTTVNSRVVQKTILRNNDVITLGHYKLKIEGLPALSPELDEKITASDTMTMQNLQDLRRARARRTIKALKHK